VVDNRQGGKNIRRDEKWEVFYVMIDRKITPLRNKESLTYRK